MKPTKNKIYCNNIKRVKMLFPSKEKADNFIRFNAEEIAEYNNHVPSRSYYCPACGGWHVTHMENNDKYVQTDNIQESAYRLTRFMTAIKKKFNKTEWQSWKTEIEKACMWVAELDGIPQYYQLVNEARRQIKHYNNEIKNVEKREAREHNVRFMKVDEERKTLIDEITDKMKDLDWDQASVIIQKLEKLMTKPEFAFSKQKIITECKKLVAIIQNPEIACLLKEMSASFKALKGKTTYMATVDLQSYVDEMDEKWNKLKSLELSEIVLNPMNQRLVKLRKTVKNRGNNYLDSETGIDKVIIALERHYDTVKNSLIEAITALQNQDNTLALEFLEAADGRLKSIPFSKKKLELTRHFLTIADKVMTD